MKLINKVLFILLVAVNAALGFASRYTGLPVTFVVILAIDLFLLFYYVRTLFRENYGLMEFERINRDKIVKARKELEEYGSRK